MEGKESSPVHESMQCNSLDFYFQFFGQRKVEFFLECCWFLNGQQHIEKTTHQCMNPETLTQVKRTHLTTIMSITLISSFDLSSTDLILFLFFSNIMVTGRIVEKCDK